MRTKIVTVATRPDPGLDQLVLSLQKHGLDYQVLGQGELWRGFGTKVILLQQYLEAIKDEYTHAIFVDAYDVAFLGGIDEIERVYNETAGDRILFSAELNCWPEAMLAGQYPVCESRWRYLNSGSYMGPINSLLAMFKQDPPEFSMDDQLYFTDIYLGDPQGAIILDTGCNLFQTTAFCYGNEFDYKDGRLINNHMSTTPVIIHGNGRTPMDKVYELSKYEHVNI